MEFKYCKLEIFLPPTHLEVVQKALQEVDAGHIGNYDSCMSVSPVTGYWRPLDGCDPYIGTNGEISCEPELKVEVTVYTENVDKTIEAVKKVHPYEEPVINVVCMYQRHHQMTMRHSSCMCHQCPCRFIIYYCSYYNYRCRI